VLFIFSTDIQIVNSYLQNIKPAQLSVCDDADSFLQTGFWGSFKACFNWSSHSFIADWGEWGKRPVMVICRPLAAGFSFAYIPWGPELPQPQEEARYSAMVVELAQALRPLLPPATAFIRFDPPWHKAGNEEPLLLQHSLLQAAAAVQAPHTVIIDLAPDEQAVLSQMKSKCRYNIGLSSRKGVTVRRMDEEGIAAFYALLQETALRDKMSIHSLEYYEKLFAHVREYCGICPKVLLYGADYEGELLAALVVLVHKGTATYLYGASSNKNRNLMAPYALQWQAMKDAKGAGCTCYDLFGIPPDDDPSHPLSGLYRFKTGFGGTIIHRPGCYDYVYRPVVKTLFTSAESGRTWVRSLKRRLVKR
jgi:lipid II:glycine glycyltransferase (peptidoglycan interpeptide bridge formation enzyme)